MTYYMLDKNQNGYLTLMGVLIVAAIGLTISVSLLLLGVGTSRTSFAMQQSYQATSLSNACEIGRAHV